MRETIHPSSLSTLCEPRFTVLYLCTPTQDATTTRSLSTDIASVLVVLHIFDLRVYCKHLHHYYYMYYMIDYSICPSEYTNLV
jgi:hypothetical protein